MATNREPKSLSSLNFLAANPPQYPVNPTEEARESLVLYISRVPGTRDIILSTFKPQLKNVTAADVTNSLYYAHLDLPSDELLAPPAPVRDENSPAAGGESATSAIPRKPLPSTAKVSKLAEKAAEKDISTQPRPGGTGVTQLLHPPPGTTMGEQRESGSPRRDAELSVPAATRYHSPVAAPIARKPLGPRPIGAPQVPKNAPTSTPASTSAPASHGSSTTHNLLRTTQASPFSAFEDAARTSPPFHASSVSRSPSPTKARRRTHSFVPFTLTLIRRDPASGNQWNVGKISSFQTNSDPQSENVDQPNSLSMDSSLGEPKIDIHIDNSGYAKFRGMPTQADIDALRSASAISLPPSRAGPVGTDGTRDNPGLQLAGSGGHGRPSLERRGDTQGFSRQVVMSYSKTWASNLKHAFRRRDHDRPRSLPGSDAAQSYPPITDMPSPPWVHHGHSRHNSGASATSGESLGSRDGHLTSASADEETAWSSSPPPLVTRPGPGLKAKGYVFSSPWDGRCEFHTGNGGRSLRCRHVLMRPGGSGGSGGVAGVSSGGHGFEGLSGGARSVSELRFNLPSGELFGSAAAGRRSRHLHEQFNGLLKLGPERWDGDGQDDEEHDDGGALDLSLGREKAGGGNRGKRAKLGKLIIHDEGLKMLDLVVAANVGVWWVAWEKSF